MDSNERKVSRLKKLEVWNPADPSKKYPLLCNVTLTIGGTSEDGETLSVRIVSDENPPFPSPHNEKWLVIQTLWLIAESDVVPKFGKRGLPGWDLAKRLSKSHSQVSDDAIKPLKNDCLIYSEDRPTTKEKSSHKNQKEKAWHLNRSNLRTIFLILHEDFIRHHIKYVVWVADKKATPQKMTRENEVAQMRFTILAYLQRELDAYEKSPQYYIDRGVNPPPSPNTKKGVYL